MKPDKFEISSGFAVVPDLLTTAEVENVRIHVREIESVGTRCLLNHRWCCEWASELRRRLAPLVPHAMPAMESLAAVQCTYFNKAKRSNWPSKVFWAIIGLGLCWVPMFGLVFALVAWAVNSHCKSWALVVSYVALAVSFLSIAASILYLLLNPGSYQ